MKILFLRHALQLSGGIDPELSSEGRERLHLSVEVLKKEGISPDVIYTSPLRRAVESAEIVSKAFGSEVVVEEGLGDAFDEARLMEIIEQASSECIAFVGHAPTMIDFVRSLGLVQIPSIPRACILLVDKLLTDGEWRYKAISMISAEGVARY